MISALPPNAQGPFKVKTVVDGDTFNLQDGTRVRVLGLDTPEIKTKAPFALEAKAFTASLIGNKDVYLVYGSEKTDRYGRHLAVVYVSSGMGNFRCLNTELLANGLAFFYSPTPGAIPNERELLSAQTSARRQGTNVWQSFKDHFCYVTRNGRAFHESTCENIAGKRTDRIEASVALDRGLSPCRSCLNPDGVHGIAGNHSTVDGPSDNAPHSNANHNAAQPVPRPQIVAPDNANDNNDHNHHNTKTDLPCCVVM